MKKILSKVLVAVSIFNGVNVSACAMEEKPANLQTGVSNSWKAYAQNERKRINGLVDWMIQNEWKHCRHFRVDLGESEEENDEIHKQVAYRCLNCCTGTELVPKLSADEENYWKPINEYEIKFEELSLPYILYGRGVCRNRAAWVLRHFFHNSIFARIVLLHAPEHTEDKDLNHLVCLYAMPDENCENKWNYYIADLMHLKGDFNITLNSLKNQNADPVFDLPANVVEYFRNSRMQIPLKTYLNSEKTWDGIGFIVESVCSEPNELERLCKELSDQYDSDLKKVEKVKDVKQQNELIQKIKETSKLLDEMRCACLEAVDCSNPFRSGNKCVQGEISKEEASKRGVTDLTMWCQKNCPEVLK